MFTVGEKYRYLPNDTICTVLSVNGNLHQARIMTDHNIELEVGFHTLEDLPSPSPAPPAPDTSIATSAWDLEIGKKHEDEEEAP